MSNLRKGTFGNYYGSYQGESNVLTRSQMVTNAQYIYSYLTHKGWTINSISALLGNMEAESGLNPGRWQSDDVGNTSLGYSLVQRTPSTKYTNWCSERGYEDPSEMDNALARIVYELENNIQWIATNSYDYSFEVFATSPDKSVSELAKAFLLNYERPADQSESVQAYRSELATNWYTVITGSSPSGSKTKKKKFNFILFNQRRRQQWISRNI